MTVSKGDATNRDSASPVPAKNVGDPNRLHAAEEVQPQPVTVVEVPYVPDTSVGKTTLNVTNVGVVSRYRGVANYKYNRG